MMMLFVYLMDRFVWMLLLTVFTTLALDLTGVMATHAISSDTSSILEENLNFNIEPDNIFHDYAIREKRQNVESPTDGRSPLLDNIFNIPIATLSAVNKVVENSLPILQNIRENRLATTERRAVISGQRNQRRENRRRLQVQVAQPDVDIYVQ